jgi:hypothetical protein
MNADCLLPGFCLILGEGWGEGETIASGKYLAPRAQTHRNRPVRSRSIVRISPFERPRCILRKYGMCRKDRGAMRMRVCRRIVSVTIHARLPVSSRTLVRQIDGVAAGATLRLKILVSVVRFRPGPPRTSFTQRPLMQVGVVVSGFRGPWLR